MKKGKFIFLLFVLLAISACTNQKEREIKVSENYLFIDNKKVENEQIVGNIKEQKKWIYYTILSKKGLYRVDKNTYKKEKVLDELVEDYLIDNKVVYYSNGIDGFIYSQKENKRETIKTKNSFIPKGDRLNNLSFIAKDGEKLYYIINNKLYMINLKDKKEELLTEQLLYDAYVKKGEIYIKDFDEEHYKRLKEPN